MIKRIFSLLLLLAFISADNLAPVAFAGKEEVIGAFLRGIEGRPYQRSKLTDEEKIMLLNRMRDDLDSACIRIEDAIARINAAIAMNPAHIRRQAENLTMALALGEIRRERILYLCKKRILLLPTDISCDTVDMLRATWKDIRKKLERQVNIGERPKALAFSVGSIEGELAGLKSEHFEWREHIQWQIDRAYQKIGYFNSLNAQYDGLLRRFREMSEPLIPKNEVSAYNKWARAHGDLPKA
jgi:hypothetical protein